jgi:hypothetical protein
MFEPPYHGEVRDPDMTPSQDLVTEFNLHLAGSIGGLLMAQAAACPLLKTLLRW